MRFSTCSTTCLTLGALRFRIQSQILAIRLDVNCICLISEVFSQSLYYVRTLEELRYDVRLDSGIERVDRIQGVANVGGAANVGGVANVGGA
jgi:hypothetical protein